MIPPAGYGTAHAACDAPAAPAGGARSYWGRGCVLTVAMLSAFSASAEIAVPVPSLQPVTLQDVLADENPGALWLRFRFVAPRVGSNAGSIGYDVAALDMDHLCDVLAVPYVSERGLDPARVIISMSSAPLDFGTSDPAVTQFFHAYRLENNSCIWEEF